MSNPFDQFDENGGAESANPFDQFDEGKKKQNKGIMSDIGTAFTEGAKSAGRAVAGAANIYTGDEAGLVEKAKAQEASQADKPEALNAFYKAFEDRVKPHGEDIGLWDAVKAGGAAVAEQPKGAGLAVVEQVPNSVPALGGGLAGMKGGAMLGAPLGPVGAAVGGVVGGVAGMFLGNAAIETGYKGIEAAQDGAVTPEEMSQVKKEGAVKAGVITGVDALTLGLSKAVTNIPARAVESATRRALTNAGVDVTNEAAVLAARQSPEVSTAVRAAQEAAFASANTIGKRAAAGGAALALETVGEGLGEYLGELAATGKANVADAVLEAMLSLGQSGAEVAWGAMRNKKTEQGGIWDAAEEKYQPPTPTLITEPAPLQRRIDDLMGINTDAMSDAERKQYESDLVAAFLEPVGVTQDENGIEVPFTMADYLNSQVKAEDTVRARPLRQQAGQAADARLQQLAEEEATTQPDIPAIPVVGPLSAAANVAVQTGAAVPPTSIMAGLPGAVAVSPSQQETSNDAALDEGSNQGQGNNQAGSAGVARSGGSVSGGILSGAGASGSGMRTDSALGNAGANGIGALNGLSGTQQVATQAPQAAGPQAGAQQAAAPQGQVADSSLNRDSSWVIRNKGTGEVVMETFDKAKVDALNTAKYEAVPIQEYLGSINGKTKDQPSAQSRETPAERAPAKPLSQWSAEEIQARLDRGNLSPESEQKLRDLLATKPKQKPKQAKQESQLSVGNAPGDAQPVTVRNGVIYIGEEPVIDYETEQDVTIQDGATPQQIADAIKASGSIGRRKVFGLESTAQEDVIGWTQMTAAQREGLVYRAGYAGANGKLNLAGVRIVKTAWASMSQQVRDKLIAASQNPIKNEDADAATVSDETAGPNQTPIKKADQPSAETVTAPAEAEASNSALSRSDILSKMRDLYQQEIDLNQRRQAEGTDFAEYESERQKIGAEKKSLGEAYEKLSQPKTDAAPEAKQDKAPAITKPAKSAEQSPAADSKAEPNPLDYTPKQYHEARLKWMAERNGVPLAEVRENYDTDAGRKESDSEWVDAVRQAFRDGKTLTRQMLDKLHEVRPGAVQEFMHDHPKAKIPDGYQTPVARKEEQQKADERKEDRAAIKSAADSKKQEEAKPAEDVKAEGKAEAIGDFGEKLGGARKDRVPSFENPLSDEDISTLPLSKIWPAAEIDDIEDKFVAAVAYAARAEVPAKPRVAYKVANWVMKVKTVRGIAQKVISGSVTKDRLSELLKGTRSLDSFAAKVAVLEAVDRDQWSRIGEVNEYPEAYRYSEDGKKIPSPSVLVNIDGKHQRFEGAKSVAEIVDRLNTAMAGDAEAKKMQFEVRGRAGMFSINKKGDKEYRKLKSFASTKEAFDFIKNNYADLVAAWDSVKESDNVSKVDVRNAENRPRTGKDWRNGKDVTDRQFEDAFGFRGVEFGNWVKQGVNAKERQGMLNQAFDAMHDLAEIIGVPPKAISLNGTLGLGFGSRGSGAASAHFEPGNLVINLTKTRGAGTLAHEWFHALDNYFARMRNAGNEKTMADVGNNQDEYRRQNFVTYKPEPLYVHKTQRSTPITRAELERYHTSNPKSGYYDPANWHKDPKHPEGVRAEVESAFADLVNALNESPMAKRARLIDKSPNGYWSRIIERGARSFENFVISKMMEGGYNNDYLANVREVQDFPRSKERYPYLMPEEVAPISEAFNALFSTIKTKETDSGVMLYNIAAPSTISAADKAIYGMAAEGKSAAEILKFIASASRSPFNRQVAKLLLKTGIVPKVMVSDSKGWKFNAGEGNKYAAAYNPTTDTVALFRPAAAERNMLHELVHAATIKALSKKGLASGQMKALFAHVENNGKSVGLFYDQKTKRGIYGMANIDEFIAEAFSNPKFQALLKQVSVPKTTGSTLSSAWHWFSRIVRGILGLPANQDSALSRALEIGVGVMREDVAIRRAENAPENAGIAQRNDAVNRMIEQWDAGELKSGVIIDLGKPSRILKRFGVPDLPVTLTQRVLVKAVREKHDVEVGDLKDLVVNIQAPIAVFKSKNGNGKIIAVTEARHADGNIVVALDLDVMRDSIAINDVRSIYPKRDSSVSNWIADGLLIGADKHKGRDWLENSAGSNSQQPQVNAALDGAIIYDGRLIRKAAEDAVIRYATGPKQTDTITVDGVERPATNANGKPIAQTEGGLRNFWRWFGDSRVVDSQGRPLVVYHGTTADIEQFDKGSAYFTTSKDLSATYAGTRFSKQKGGGNIIPAYLKISNPAPYDGYTPASVVANYKSAGFDGMWNGSGNGKASLFVTFDPAQIKSAVGNNGDFDPANPDIRYNVADDGWSVAEPSKMDDFIYTLQDKQVDLKRVTQAIKATGKKIADQFNPYLQEELFYGRSAKGVKDFLDFELRPMLNEMQQANVDMGDFEEYLWNRHAEERNVQIAKINKDMPDGGSGIKTADARKYLQGLDPTRRAVLEKIAGRIDAMNKASQRVLVESGLETQETIDAWNGAYKHYVPLQREDVDSGHVGTGKGFSIRGASSKRAMGSGRQVVDIIANLTMQRERNIVRAEKNRVSNALLGLALQNPNADFWKVDQAPKERVVQEKAIYIVRDAEGKKLDDFTRMQDAEKFAKQNPGSEIEQTWGDRVEERIVPGFQSRDNVILTRVNGKDHYITFNERDERAMRLALSLKNMDVDSMGRALSVVGKATRYLASVNTQYNPVFGVINLVRDVQGALLNVQSTPIAGEQKRVFGYTVDALRGIYADIRAHRRGEKPTSKWANLFEEFQKEGGQTGYRDQYANAEARAEAIISELNQFKEGAPKKLARAVFGWLSDYNETMENAVRLAAYKVAKEKGLSNQQAASIAKNVTVNFNRKGQATTQIGALYAFFNASVQGTARIAETLFEKNDGDIKSVRLSKLGKRIITGGIMLGSMQAMLLAAAGFDDDEPPEFIRERSLIMPIGDGKYLTLPMPLGFHVIPGIGRIATEFAMSGFKDPAKRTVDLLGMFAESFNPIGSSGLSIQTLTPSVVDPFAALAENRDFTGREIYRENFNANDPSPGHARAKDVATVWSRYLSEAINFITGGTEFKPGAFSPSPDSIDYLIAQAGGGVMREMNKVGQTAGAAYTGDDLPLYKIPLVGRFVGDTEGQSGHSQKFYNAVREINMHEREIKGLREAGRIDEAREYIAENPVFRLAMLANRTEVQVRKLRDLRRKALEEGDSDKVRLINDQITGLVSKFNERSAPLLEQ